MDAFEMFELEKIRPLDPATRFRNKHACWASLSKQTNWLSERGKEGKRERGYEKV